MGLEPNSEEEGPARKFLELGFGCKEVVEIQVLEEPRMETAVIQDNLADNSREEVHSDSFHVQDWALSDWNVDG